MPRHKSRDRKRSPSNGIRETAKFEHDFDREEDQSLFNHARENLRQHPIHDNPFGDMSPQMYNIETDMEDQDIPIQNQ